MVKLTKADILKGTAAVKSVFIKSLGGEVDLRPLNDGEWAEVQAILAGAIGMNIDAKRKQATPKMDLAVYARHEYDSNCLAGAYGLSCNGEVWQSEEIRKLKAGAAEEIANKVFELSGVSPGSEQALSFFRRKRRRAGDSGSSAIGDTAGEDSGGNDASPEDSS